MKKFWFRFNNQSKQININDLYVYEQIILIYETIEKKEVN